MNSIYRHPQSLKKRVVIALIISTIIIVTYKMILNSKNGISYTKLFLFINSLIINDLALR